MAAHYQLMVVRTYCTRLLLCCYLRGLQNHLDTQPPTSASAPAGIAGTSSRLRLYFSLPVCTAPVCLLCAPLSHLSPLNPSRKCAIADAGQPWLWVPSFLNLDCALNLLSENRNAGEPFSSHSFADLRICVYLRRPSWTPRAPSQPALLNLVTYILVANCHARDFGISCRSVFVGNLSAVSILVLLPKGSHRCL